MNSIHFLDAAYTVAWIVYLGYMARILVRMRAVKQETEEVERANSTMEKPARISSASH